MSYYNNQQQQPKRGSFLSGMLSAAQSGLETAKGLHQTYKQMKQPPNQYGQPYAQPYAQGVPSAPYQPPPPTVSLDDYPQFTQTVIDAVALGSKRYFQNMGDSKKYKEIQPILQQIATLPQSVLLGQEPLPFKPKKGNFYGYKSGGTRRKRKHGKKSRKH
jgi:hypothetical protein